MLMANYGRMQGLIAVILLVLYVQPNCSGLMPNTDQPPKCTTVTRTNISEDPGCVGQSISEMFVRAGGRRAAGGAGGAGGAGVRGLCAAAAVGAARLGEGAGHGAETPLGEATDQSTCCLLSSFGRISACLLAGSQHSTHLL